MKALNEAGAGTRRPVMIAEFDCKGFEEDAGMGQGEWNRHRQG